MKEKELESNRLDNWTLRSCPKYRADEGLGSCTQCRNKICNKSSNKKKSSDYKQHHYTCYYNTEEYKPNDGFIQQLVIIPTSKYNKVDNSNIGEPQPLENKRNNNNNSNSDSRDLVSDDVSDHSRRCRCHEGIIGIKGDDYDYTKAIETIKDDLKTFIDGSSYYTDYVSDPSAFDILFGTKLGTDVYIKNHPGNIRFRGEMFVIFKDEYEASYSLNLFSQRCNWLLWKAVQYIYSYGGRRCLKRDEDEDCWIPLDLVGTRKQIRIFLYSNKTKTEEERSKHNLKHNQYQHQRRDKQNLERLRKISRISAKKSSVFMSTVRKVEEATRSINTQPLFERFLKEMQDKMTKMTIDENVVLTTDYGQEVSEFLRDKSDLAYNLNNNNGSLYDNDTSHSNSHTNNDDEEDHRDAEYDYASIEGNNNYKDYESGLRVDIDNNDSDSDSDSDGNMVMDDEMSLQKKEDEFDDVWRRRSRITTTAAAAAAAASASASASATPYHANSANSAVASSPNIEVSDMIVDDGYGSNNVDKDNSSNTLSSVNAFATSSTARAPSICGGINAYAKDCSTNTTEDMHYDDDNDNNDNNDNNDDDNDGCINKMSDFDTSELKVVTITNPIPESSPFFKWKINSPTSNGEASTKNNINNTGMYKRKNCHSPSVKFSMDGTPFFSFLFFLVL